MLLRECSESRQQPRLPHVIKSFRPTAPPTRSFSFLFSFLSEVSVGGVEIPESRLEDMRNLGGMRGSFHIHLGACVGEDPRRTDLREKGRSNTGALH